MSRREQTMVSSFLFEVYDLWVSFFVLWVVGFFSLWFFFYRFSYAFALSLSLFFSCPRDATLGVSFDRFVIFAPLAPTEMQMGGSGTESCVGLWG